MSGAGSTSIAPQSFEQLAAISENYRRLDRLAFAFSGNGDGVKTEARLAAGIRPLGA